MILLPLYRMMSEVLGILDIEKWTAIDMNVLSGLKTPIERIFSTDNSHLIREVLRQAICSFSETINSIDRKFCTLANEFRSTRTRKYLIRHSETTNSEITTFAPIAFECLRTRMGIRPMEFQASFHDGDLLEMTKTGKSDSQMYRTSDEVN